MRLALLFLVIPGLWACSNTYTQAERLAWLGKTAEECGLPPSTLDLVGIDQLRFRPPNDATYESVDCALAELKKAPFPIQMGFVGNEVFEPEKK